LQALERLNTDGSPDSTFGSDGYTQVDGGDAGAFVLTSAGKIVMPVSFSGNVQFEPLRLLSDGLADPSFGFQGFAGDSPSQISAESIATLPNGQILSANAVVVDNTQGVVIRRYNANGAIDSTFAPKLGIDGQNGSIFIVSANQSSGGYSTYDIGTDSRGNIYLGESSYGIMRFTASGKLDTTFGSNGLASLTLAGNFFIEPTGQILATTGAGLVTRLTADGQLDTSFNSTGTVTLPSTFTEQAGVFATFSNNQILVGGTSNAPSGTTCLTVMRLNADGSIDTSFGTNGLAIADMLPAEMTAPFFRTGYAATASSLAVSTNGTIVLAGTDNGNDDYGIEGYVAPTVAEFLSTGQLNSAFATDGQTVSSGFASQQYYGVSGLIEQSDGSMIITGPQEAALPGNDSNLYLLRYTAQGVLDGSITTNPPALGNPFVFVNDAIAGRNGSVLLAGLSTRTQSGTAAFLARYLTVDGISSAFSRPVFKSAVVAGAPFNARLPLVLTNTGPAISGSSTITYYANTTDTIDGGQILLTTVSRKIGLKTGGRVVLTTVVRSLPSSLPAGSYYLLAEVTGPDGLTSIAATSTPVAVVAPAVKLSATVDAVNPAVVTT
jgi:uncharacterized delta-60 repeat protein